MLEGVLQGLISHRNQGPLILDEQGQRFSLHQVSRFIDKFKAFFPIENKEVGVPTVCAIPLPIIF